MMNEKIGVGQEVGDQAAPIVELKGLSKYFGTLKVLDDINLSVHKGEVLAIIGPSGSGKSTLLRCINFLEKPTEGLLTVDGITIDPSSHPTLAHLRALRRKVGMVFQSFNLFPHMTVLENVSLPQQRVLRRSKGEADKVSKALLDRVGLLSKVAQYPNRCSGGQQQRVAIARALALEPSVMLFDEPTSALDPELGLEVLSVMRELARSGMTMIVVTHEMSFAENVSEHTLIMADGHEIEYGPSKTVIRQPKSERAAKFLAAVNHR